jgi:type III secretion system low calcium response chaperone LcrH/SycD
MVQGALMDKSAARKTPTTWQHIEQFGRFIQGKPLEEIVVCINLALESVVEGKREEYTAAELEEIRTSGQKALQDVMKGKPLYPLFGVDPQLIDQLYAEGYRLYEAGLYKKALSFFDVLTFFNFREPTYALAAAACHQRLKDYQQAAVIYRWMADMDTSLPLPFFYLYECYMQEGNHEAARLALEELVRRAKASPEYAAQVSKGELLLRGHLEQYGSVEAPKATQSPS